MDETFFFTLYSRLHEITHFCTVSDKYNERKKSTRNLNHISQQFRLVLRCVLAYLIGFNLHALEAVVNHVCNASRQFFDEDACGCNHGSRLPLNLYVNYCNNMENNNIITSHNKNNLAIERENGTLHRPILLRVDVDRRFKLYAIIKEHVMHSYFSFSPRSRTN